MAIVATSGLSILSALVSMLMFLSVAGQMPVVWLLAALNIPIILGLGIFIYRVINKEHEIMLPFKMARISGLLITGTFALSMLMVSMAMTGGSQRMIMSFAMQLGIRPQLIITLFMIVVVLAIFVFLVDLILFIGTLQYFKKSVRVHQYFGTNFPMPRAYAMPGQMPGHAPGPAPFYEQQVAAYGQHPQHPQQQPMQHTAAPAPVIPQEQLYAEASNTSAADSQEKPQSEPQSGPQSEQ
jgi:hypothetical protein